MRVNNLLKGFRWVERHKIDNPPTSDRYQIPLSLAYLRGTSPYFLDSLPAIDEEPLPLWIEHAAGIDYTTNTPFTCPKIWTPIPAGQKYIDIYRGNPRITTDRSRGDLVFDFFDDFPGAALDTGKWTVTSGGASVSNSIASIVRGASDCNFNSIPAFGQNYAIRSRLKSTHFANTSYYESIRWNVNGTTYAMASYCWPWADCNGKYMNDNSGAYTISAMSGWAADTYAIQDIIRNGSSSAIYKINNANAVTISTNTPSGNGTALFYVGNAGAAVYADWVLVRKYTATEPTHQLIDTPKTNPLWRGG